MVMYDLTKIKDLYPFDAHFADINGHRMHYIDEGPRAGRPVIMVHGNPTWSFYYRELIKHLANKGYRAIAADHIGCGLSDKPSKKDYAYALKNRVDDFSAFVGSLNLADNPILVMHDWGGMVAMQYATQNPHKVAGLVVLNTAAFTKPIGKPLPVRLKLIRHLAPFGKPMVLYFNAFAKGALCFCFSQPVSKQVKQGFILPYNSPANRIATYEFVRDIPLENTDKSYKIAKETEDNLYKLQGLPMRGFWGLRDFVFDKDYLKEWQRRFPNAEFTAFDDGNHYILEDKRAEILAGIDKFLEANKL